MGRIILQGEREGQKGVQKQIDVLSLFECSTPMTPYKVRRRQLFGGQVFASETRLALFEGLISQEEFEHVRNIFYQAQKIRAHHDVGFISKQEYYAHAVTLFSGMLGAGECNESNHRHQCSFDTKSRGGLDQHVEHDQRENGLDSIANVKLGRQSSSKDSEESAKRNIARCRSNEMVAEKIDNEVNSQQQQVEKSDLSQSYFGKIDTVEKAESDTKQYLTEEEDEYKSIIIMETDEEVKLQEEIGEQDEEYDRFNLFDNTPTASNDLDKDQNRSSISSYKADDMSGQEALLKFLQSRQSPSERNVRKLQWDSQDTLPSYPYDSNNLSKNYVRRVQNNNRGFEESDSASNPSDPMSPAPSTSVLKEDATSPQRGVDGSELESQGQSLLKKEYQYRMSLIPNNTFVKETLKSPSTSSDRSISTQFSSVSNLSRKPTTVKDFGAKKRIENKKAGITGFQLAEDALNLYEEMRLGHAYKWLILELNPGTQQIDVTDYGEANSKFQDLVEHLPAYKCCYAVFNQGERSWGLMKIIFIHWCPDNATIKQKMIYASSKDFFKSFLGNVALEIQATEVDDLEEARVMSQIR